MTYTYAHTSHSNNKYHMNESPHHYIYIYIYGVYNYIFYECICTDTYQLGIMLICEL